MIKSNSAKTLRTCSRFAAPTMLLGKERLAYARLFVRLCSSNDLWGVSRGLSQSTDADMIVDFDIIAQGAARDGVPVCQSPCRHKVGREVIPLVFRAGMGGLWEQEMGCSLQRGFLVVRRTFRNGSISWWLKEKMEIKPKGDETLRDFHSAVVKVLLVDETRFFTCINLAVIRQRN